uniref:Uncharacterized protein n=1 Tax=Brassica oleracea var. oleracea TaxID=109376 RepID=A0A0D3BAN1_BRAOL
MSTELLSLFRGHDSFSCLREKQRKQCFSSFSYSKFTLITSPKGSSIGSLISKFSRPSMSTLTLPRSTSLSKIGPSSLPMAITVSSCQ